MAPYSSRYAIVADIHSNLAALKAVLEAISREDVASVICLVDIVGYGPSPCEAIAALRTVRLHCIRGNHDRYALGENTDNIRTATAEAVDYTRRALGPAEKRFLEELADTQLFDDRILLVHGSPRERDEYILTIEGATANYRYFRSQYAGVYLCFFGHTHIPTVVGEGKVVHDMSPGHVLKLKPLAPYLINPGSVGQPRDGNPDAAYAILDMAERSVTFKRVAYDVEDTRRRVAQAGLQRHLGDRLAVGR